MAKQKTNEMQRAKLLKLWEILYQHSDEEHPLSTGEIIEFLAQQDISVDRRTLYEYIKILNRCGYEVMCVKHVSNYYYMEDRAFELSELKILLDAIQSAKFISEKKTETLVSKILRHAGKYRAELLKENFICYDTEKRPNEAILYSIDTIINAIINGKKISFKYFDYNLQKEKVFRKDGKEYLQTPVQLIYTNDNYYLVTFSDKYNDFVNFRLDRMSDVKETELSATKLECIENFNCQQYKKEMFSMYSGTAETVQLVVHNSLIDVILDRFGMDTQLMAYDKDHFKIEERVEISPTFFAWCFTFKDELQIQSPKLVAEAVISHLDAIRNTYENAK